MQSHRLGGWNEKEQRMKAPLSLAQLLQGCICRRNRRTNKFFPHPNPTSNQPIQLFLCTDLHTQEIILSKVIWPQECRYTQGKWFVCHCNLVFFFIGTLLELYWQLQVQFFSFPLLYSVLTCCSRSY